MVQKVERVERVTRMRGGLDRHLHKVTKVVVREKIANPYAAHSGERKENVTTSRILGNHANCPTSLRRRGTRSTND